MTTIPVVVWKPDQPDLLDDGSATVKNCIPRTANSYGPMPGLTVYSGAIDARAQGAVGVTDNAGNAFAFVGTSAKLWKAAAGSTAWADVSKGAGYTTANDQRWSSAFFTPNLVAMANFADPIQAFTLGSSALFADLSAGAPRAKYLAVIRDFLMAAHTFDAVDGTRPTRVWWPAIGDPTNWPTAGSAAAQAVQSDFQDLNLGDFGQIMGIVGGLGTADGAVFFERGIVRISYVGPPAIFAFQAVEGARGTPAPGSIAQLGAFVIYLGEDDLYAFDGTVSTPLGAEMFAKTLFSDIDQASFYRISAAFDPINKLYFLAYPSGSGSGNLNKLLCYNWFLKRATLIDGLGDIELLFRSLSFGYTLEGLDAVNTSVDALPFGLDSRAWTGGKLLLSAFDTSHKLNYFTGSSLAPTVDTTEAQLIPGRRAYVGNVRPIVDGGTPSVAVGVRERQVDAVTFGSAIAIDSLGCCPQRASGRYHRARITLAAADSGWTQIAGLELADEDIQDDGQR